MLASAISITDEIARIVQAACGHDRNIFGYGIWTHHITQVVRIGKKLANQFNADAEIVEISALLHDYAGIKDQTLHNNIINTELLKQKIF